MTLRISRIGRNITPLLRLRSRVLDIGCGNGELSTVLKAQDVTYEGVDLLGSNRTDVRVTKSDVPYPFADKSFDHVLLLFVLHHTQDQNAVLREAKRLARHSIVIIEDVPRNRLERWCMIIVDAIGNRMISSRIPLPFNFRENDAWLDIFRTHGLQLRSQSHVFPLPFPRLNHICYEVIP